VVLVVGTLAGLLRNTLAERRASRQELLGRSMSWRILTTSQVMRVLKSVGEAPDVLDQVRVLRLVRVGGPVQLDGLPAESNLHPGHIATRSS
jgi:hypothetical protein